MAHHKDAIKRIRTSRQARTRNRSNRTEMRHVLKEIRSLVEDGDVAKASASFPETQSTLHTLVSKGVIHRNTAARYIGRLAAKINALKKEKNLPTNTVA